MHDLKAALVSNGYDTYLTSVGGSGLGILSPYGQLPLPEAPLTPPETSDFQDVDAAAGTAPAPLRDLFESKPIEELSNWSDSLGRWLFV